MHRLENSFDSGTVKQIRRNCQCGYGMEEKLALVKELKAEASNIGRICGFRERRRAAGLFCEDGELFLQFGFCPCPMLAEVERLETDTWCQCTTGTARSFLKRHFPAGRCGAAESIKMGDDVCLMKITLHNPVWR